MCFIPMCLFCSNMRGQHGAPVTFDLRKGRIHNWAMLPVTPDGRGVLPGILAQLVG